MPELPEVEVTRMGISPHLIGQTISDVVIYQPQLRWPIPDSVHSLTGQTILKIRRRAKYLLVDTAVGSLIIHLGMSGRLRVVPTHTNRQKHDHVEIRLDDGNCLRLNDARRFGAVLWQGKNDDSLPQWQKLGPEPLTDAFDGKYLHQAAQKRSLAVKSFIMNNEVVVGVGNIYANEALFLSGIHPSTPVNKIHKKAFIALADNIKQVLQNAILQGGTTLKDFTQADGNPGYFSQYLRVYGRKDKPCEVCSTTIQSLTIGQRNSFYCASCQPEAK
jgi:formamidopyrimidine-DNA glycosylase